MQWILLGVIALALLILARYHPKLGFGILGGLVFCVAVVIYFTSDMAQRNNSKISVDDVVIEHAVINPAYGGDFKLNGRLGNNHVHATLREVVLSITMLDCSDNSDANCLAIGQDEEIINIKIPPKQARDISRNISFESFRLTNYLRWNIKVTSTKSL